jgi:pimeloyl-ACP methyl ester carboxylesterase
MDRTSVIATVFIWAALSVGQAVYTPPAFSTPLQFASCGPSQVAVQVPGLECATLAVPLARSPQEAEGLSLAVQRLASAAGHRGTIVFLTGGPGQAALPGFEAKLATLAALPALQGYELVSFDQRGTGQSGFLSCQQSESTLQSLVQVIAACGASLGPKRASFTSQESAEDLAALRQALGGPQLSLVAVSYGARVAGMFVREHPSDASRLVLDSPVPLDGSDALGTQRERALPRVLDKELCGKGACRAFTARPYGDLVRLARQVRHRPLQARIPGSLGRLQRVTITESRLYTLVSLLDVLPGLRVLAPAAISAASRGNIAPLARLIAGLALLNPAEAGTSSDYAPTQPTVADVLPVGLRATASTPTFSTAVYASTYCIENPLPWSPSSDPNQRPAALSRWLTQLPIGVTSPFLPPVVASQPPITACLGWPATPPPPPLPDSVSITPTLILSGEDDLRTPYEQAQGIASTYGDARLLSIPGVGHSTITSDITGCAREAAVAFITTGAAPSSCAPSRERQILPVPPRSLQSLSPSGSPSPTAGRVARAAAITLEDVINQPSLAGGGLRGGWWTIRGNVLLLHNTVDISTVKLRASLILTPLGLRGDLIVVGSHRGLLHVNDRAMFGHIAGSNVRVRLDA